MGGILGLGASFSLLKVRDILGPQFGGKCRRNAVLP